ncbi:MAG: chorismate synthase [Gammaproteobacteria bacterium]
MASNSFGNLFRITTWGESHGKAIGVVIDGCPAGLTLTEDDINQALAKRAPGRSVVTSPRRENDEAEIYSGVFEGKTTGAPIAIVIMNRDADSSKYEPIKHLLRPGHANYTYLQKYGCFDYRGGGRASARETACRVAAGAVAQVLLTHLNISVLAYIKQIGKLRANVSSDSHEKLLLALENSALFCPDQPAERLMIDSLLSAKQAGDSLGGIVEFRADNLPIGLGDPIYEKLEANLAKAMLSIPASKGFEIGEGFVAAEMVGSMHNDEFMMNSSNTLDKTAETITQVTTASNHAGGTLGGISSGMPLIGRVAFKPTSSINKSQRTLDLAGQAHDFTLPAGSRHDPCVAIRAVPVVQAMCALVLADAVLMNRGAKL